MTLQGRHPYDVSKACVDMLAQSYFSTYNLPVAIARCGNIYGGGDLNWSRIIPDTIRCCLRGVPLEIRSDGTYVRDYIYVKDVTTAFMRIAEFLEGPKVKGQAFNFSPLYPISVIDLVRKIQKLMDCEELEPRIINNAIGEIYSQYLDSSKARQLLGWQPRYNLDQGLSETIEWYKQYLASEGR
jgi:CDP-glucose 4,6-dehydratase